ncbi:MAG: Pnap_2097 family protein [Pseudomonadota bacterium]
MGKIRNKAHKMVSNFVVWRYRSAGVTIGKDCLISRSAKIDLTNPAGIVIGDETAISFNSSIMSHDFVNARHVNTTIGNQCFIGARSIIMPGVTIGDNCIVGAGSVVYSDVHSNTVVAGNPARVIERNVRIGNYGIKLDSLMGKVGYQSAPDAPQSSSVKASTSGDDRDLLNELFGEVPADLPFADSQIDSFDLISIRARIEALRGTEISDSDWEKVETPAQAFALVNHATDAPERKQQASKPNFYRRLEISMPQMGANGLSESWLFKEMGDAHWQMICAALGVKSKDIQDQDGNRLYATFTRIKLHINGTLGDFKENDQLEMTGQMKRVGAGIFLSNFQIHTGAVRATLSMMSSFARFGVEGDNSSLTKGQPSLPENFTIPNLSEPPAIMTEYKSDRSQDSEKAIFSTNYELVPYHDINGVGLLYFAAYPAIHDISLARFVPENIRLNTISREISYFANSGEDSAVEFQLEALEDKGDRIETIAHLCRTDGKRMASVRATYAKRT